jgi:hypothetical protein
VVSKAVISVQISAHRVHGAGRTSGTVASGRVGHVVTRAGMVVVLCAMLSCKSAADDPANARRSPVAVVVHDEPLLPAPADLTLDTVTQRVIELWPLSFAAGKQVDESRRIVEHLQADVALLRGFETAALLASGDGSRLVLIAVWTDSGAATHGRDSLVRWLRTGDDTIALRKLTGSGTVRVSVRKSVGTPPLLLDNAMLHVTRYAMKPGHSFGALASLADTNLSLRVLRDTSAQGGATLATADSGALYIVLQARNATALDPALSSTGPLPFWAPFATRDEQLLAVVAVVRRR